MKFDEFKNPKAVKAKIDSWIIAAKTNKERTQIIIAVVMACLVTLWIFQKPSEANTDTGAGGEFSMNIPRGMLVVPLELSNAKQLSTLISKLGVIDVFTGESHCLAKNLRVIKLSQEEQVSFGAFVPENKSSQLQSLFSDKKLKGALRSGTAGATEFFPLSKKENTTTTYQTEDEL